MNAAFVHRPVMAREVVDLLVPVPAGTVVDATTGAGGHAGLLLSARPDLRILGLDRDPAAVAAAGKALAVYGDRARVVHAGFEDLTDIVRAESEGNIVGVLFDLGVSSPQLDRAERGFSYWSDAPLDMRMDSSQALTAADVVNGYDEAELVRVIEGNGEERYARRIAREIATRRPLRTTGDLVDAIKAAIPAPARRTGGHPARRTFQAVRMEVNRELPNLAEGLDDSVHLLTPGGRVLVLAYHSLEDRLVKQRFAEWSGTAPRAGHVPRGLPEPAPTPEEAPRVRLLTRRPLRPSEAEVQANPRASSARLRAVERLAT
jgi:16S rRNA (cytosine1402-N4)-methyltransferase